MTHRVNLTVGKVSVTGEGPTPQAARHAAARLALEELRKEGVMKDEASKGITKIDMDLDSIVIDLKF